MSEADALYAGMREAPAEWGMMPFWFWNDDLDEAELKRQLHAFRDGGFGGVVIHPRVGLSRSVGYLTERYFELVRAVVDECAALGMRVILYDEGSYPSGSACGLVVAQSPEHASRALALVEHEVTGPWRGYWRAASGRALVNRVVCVVLGEVRDGVVRPETLRLLPADERAVVRAEVGAGAWRLMGCLDVPSGGVIRGVFPEQEDGTATAPPAGDILSPEAVASFIGLTHDAYARALRDHLGTTVVAMFTDEPKPTGKRPRPATQPYTPGFAAWLAPRLGRSEDEVLRWLPALWRDYGEGTAAFRSAYARAVEDRVDEVFYAAQSEWCERHGLALTGHPSASNDMASLARFHWPGQDQVWRWVLPPGETENATGVEGPHSVSAKAATSAARAHGRRRNATELFGAYGWRLSLDDVKWLLDWHLARGTNLFIPHACFYSVRGGRAFESEPDVALHNCWWPHFQHLARYTRRVSWLLTDCEHVCDVAVLGAGHALPWRAARSLYERQIDFLYVDALTVSPDQVVGGRLRVGVHAFSVVVVDGEEALTPGAEAMLAVLRVGGGTVLRVGEVADLEPRLGVDPPMPGLRVLHVRKQWCDAFALFNEGEDEVAGRLRVPVDGDAEWWDVLRDRRTPARGARRGSDGMTVPLVSDFAHARRMGSSEGAALTA